MELQRESAKRFFKLLILSNLVLLALLLLPTVVGGIQWNHNPFVHRSFFVYSDRFADFYNPAQYAMDKNLVPDVVTNSPPFLHFCGYLVSKFIYIFWPEGLINQMGSGAAFGATPQGYALWLATAGAMLLVLGVQCKRLFKVGLLRAELGMLLCVGISHPFLYAIDRGNYVLFVAVLLALFIADYEEHPYRAAVWLGLAAAFKLYPALLGLLFLRDKRWKHAAACAGTGIGVTLGSLAFFSTGASGFWVTVQGYTMWLSIVGAVGVFLGSKCGHLLKLSALRGQFTAFACVLCSYPFLYAIDRGNYIFFVAVLLVATLADYEEHPYRAAVWLGLAAALKLYPALLGVLFLRDKKWKPAAMCAATGAGLSLASLGFFSTGASGFALTVRDWVQKVQLYNSVGNDYPSEQRTINEMLLNNSGRTPFFFLENARYPEGGLQQMLSGTAWVGTVSLVLLAVVLVLCLLLRKNHDVFLLCSLLMILYPLNSGVYNLTLVVVPLLYWCKNEPNHFWVPAAGFAALLCKTIIRYSVVSPGVIVTMHGLLSAPLLLFLVAAVLWLRKQELARAVRAWCNGLHASARGLADSIANRASTKKIK